MKNSKTFAPIYFSIILPTYNRSKMLKKAISSVLAQDFKNWELIVVDDASTDDTTAVVKSFLSNKITYLKNFENAHKGASRNNGIKIAKGKFITFLDDDDYYQVQHICKMLCSTLNLLETEPKLRDKINDYVVNVFDKEEQKFYKEDTPKKTYEDNIINVSFVKSDT